MRRATYSALITEAAFLHCQFESVREVAEASDDSCRFQCRVLFGRCFFPAVWVCFGVALNHQAIFYFKADRSRKIIGTSFSEKLQKILEKIFGQLHIEDVTLCKFVHNLIGIFNTVGFFRLRKTKCKSITENYIIFHLIHALTLNLAYRSTGKSFEK